jgi:hypothetical protein
MSSFREHIEVEIAVLAGVLGFFIGGLIRINREIIDIVLSAVITGTLAFIITYYAMMLVFSGKKDGINDDDGGFVEGIPPVVATPTVKNNKPENKGGRLDIKSEDDGLFDDIYGKQK